MSEPIQISASGMHVMGIEDLSAAFFQLTARVETDAPLSTSVHGCVDHSSQLVT